MKPPPLYPIWSDDTALKAFFSKNAAVSKWAWCDDASLDHMYRKESANPALFSLLLTPDLLLENTVSSIAPPLMMCNHSGFLHNVFSVRRDHQASLISRDALGRWWYTTSLNREDIFTPHKQADEYMNLWNKLSRICLISWWFCCTACLYSWRMKTDINII